MPWYMKGPAGQTQHRGTHTHIACTVSLGWWKLCCGGAVLLTDACAEGDVHCSCEEANNTVGRQVSCRSQHSAWANCADQSMPAGYCCELAAAAAGCSSSTPPASPFGSVGQGSAQQAGTQDSSRSGRQEKRSGHAHLQAVCELALQQQCATCTARATQPTPHPAANSANASRDWPRLTVDPSLRYKSVPKTGSRCEQQPRIVRRRDCSCGAGGGCQQLLRPGLTSLGATWYTGFSEIWPSDMLLLGTAQACSLQERPHCLLLPQSSSAAGSALKRWLATMATALNQEHQTTCAGC